MAFQYSDIEDAVAVRLIEKLPIGYEVIALPQKENEHTIPDNGALIIVAYADSQFDPPDSVDVITQQENVTVLCNIKAMNLRGAISINSALQLVKMVLTGYKPPHLSKLQLQKIEFDERNPENNYFSYNVFFTGKKKHVEVPDAEIETLLQEVYFREQITII